MERRLDAGCVIDGETLPGGPSRRSASLGIGRNPAPLRRSGEYRRFAERRALRHGQFDGAPMRGVATLRLHEQDRRGDRALALSKPPERLIELGQHSIRDCHSLPSASLNSTSRATPRVYQEGGSAKRPRRWRVIWRSSVRGTNSDGAARRATTFGLAQPLRLPIPFQLHD